MLRIIKMKPSVGKAIVYAVVVSEDNATHLHDLLTRFFEREGYAYFSITYMDRFACPCVSIAEYNVTAFMNADEMIANGTL